MQFITLASFTLLAATIQAQTPAELAAQIPACAIPCDVVAIAAVGCDISDYACHCARSNQLVSLSAPCLSKSSNCTITELTTLMGLTSQICKELNITASASSTTVTPAGTASATVMATSSSSPLQYTGAGAKTVLSGGSVVVVGALTALYWFL